MLEGPICKLQKLNNHVNMTLQKNSSTNSVAQFQAMRFLCQSYFLINAKSF